MAIQSDLLFTAIREEWIILPEQQRAKMIYQLLRFLEKTPKEPIQTYQFLKYTFRQQRIMLNTAEL